MSRNACPVDGCPDRHRPGQLLCRRHWYKVPKELRDDVWRTARAMHNEEELGGPGYRAWREARGAAIAAVEQLEAEQAGR